MDGINLKNVPSHNNNPRSNFDLSFNRKFDFKFGQLYPFVCQPVMPSDKFDYSYNYLLRFAPFVSQVFQKYVVNFDFYYVPSRVLYKNFDAFMTAGYNGKKTYVHPYIDVGYMRESMDNPGPMLTHHSIFDAFDIPLKFLYNAPMRTDKSKINALPLFAYLRTFVDYWIGADTALNSLREDIYNQKYMCTEGDVTSEFYSMWMTIATKVGSSDFQPLNRLYPLDYFTQGRSNAQLGPVMTIPLQLVNTDTNGTNTFKVVNSAPSSELQPTVPPIITLIETNGSLTLEAVDDTSDPVGNITVNGSVFNNVASIPDFYSAARIQEFLSLYGFTGFLPEDTIAAEFGVKNKDSRLQRSEFIHHSSHIVEIGEVFSNAVNYVDSADSDLKDIPGVGTAIGKSSSGDRGFKFNVPEYGYIIGLCSVYPEASYSEGLPKHFRMLDRFDYPHPMFANLSMVPVKNEELFIDISDTDSWAETFNYLPPYSDYKVGINRVNGTLNASLSYMNAGRLFGPLSQSEVVAVPQFNDAFTHVLPGQNHLNRTFNNVSDLPYDCPLFMDIQSNIMANRPLPYYGLPKF